MVKIVEPFCENLAQFVTMAEAAEPVWKCRTSHEASGKNPDKPANWYGTDTWEDAINRAKHGSPQDAALVQCALDTIKQHSRPMLIKGLVYDVAGERPHINRAVAGDPASMIRKSRTMRVSHPVVRFLINMGALGDVDGGWRVNRGAAILSQIDAIENAGQRVEITLVWFASDRGHSHEARCVIKQASEPCNVEALAFALVNPSMHRRFVFALREARAELKSAWDYVYGVTRPVTPEPGQVYIPHLTSSDLWAAKPESAMVHMAKIFETAAKRIETNAA